MVPSFLPLSNDLSEVGLCPFRVAGDRLRGWDDHGCKPGRDVRQAADDDFSPRWASDRLLQPRDLAFSSLSICRSCSAATLKRVSRSWISEWAGRAMDGDVLPSRLAKRAKPISLAAIYPVALVRRKAR